MNTQATCTAISDERRFGRVPAEGNIRYTYAPGEDGYAVWNDVGPAGACIRMGRYLRPGKNILLMLPATNEDGDSVELKGQITWCRPTKDRHEFLTGLRIMHDGPDVGYVLFMFMEDGLLGSRELRRAKAESGIKDIWKTGTLRRLNRRGLKVSNGKALTSRA